MDKSRRKSRLSQVKQVKLIKYFFWGLPAFSTAILADVKKNTPTLYLRKLFHLINVLILCLRQKSVK